MFITDGLTGIGICILFSLSFSRANSIPNAYTYVCPHPHALRRRSDRYDIIYSLISGDLSRSEARTSSPEGRISTLHEVTTVMTIITGVPPRVPTLHRDGRETQRYIGCAMRSGNAARVPP